MSEMIERVARAILALDGCNPDIDDWYLHGLVDARDIARAAIEAMREPGQAVINAVEKKAEERYTASPNMLRWYGEDVWVAGIDAALAKTNEVA